MINAFIFEFNQLVTFVKVGRSTPSSLGTRKHAHIIYVNVQDVNKTTLRKGCYNTYLSFYYDITVDDTGSVEYK